MYYRQVCRRFYLVATKRNGVVAGTITAGLVLVGCQHQSLLGLDMRLWVE